MKPFEAKVTEQWSLPVDEVRALRLTTADSSIRVTGVETDSIRVQATKTARAATVAAAQTFLDEIQIERRRDGALWIIEAVWPKPRPREIESAGVSFDIQVPRSLSVEASSSNGAIEATGAARALLRTSNGRVTASEIAESLEARTSNGAVHVEGCGGPVQVTTENGRVEIRRAQNQVTAHTSNGSVHVTECAGPLEAKTENGRVEIRSAQDRINAHTSNGALQIDDCPGPIEARTNNGGIAIRRARHAVHARTSEGRIDVELDRGDQPVEAELTTSNSAIELALPTSVSARLVADTCNARITMDPPGPGQFSKSPTHLETVLGTGEGSVRLRTSNGAIRIHLTG